VPDAVLDDHVAYHPHEAAGLPCHHIPDIADDRKLGKIGICRIHRFCNQVRHTGSTHFAVTTGEAVHLPVLARAGLADMVVDDQNLVLRKTALKKEVLLPCTKVGEDLKRRVGRHLRHGERFQLPDKNRFIKDSGTGNCLREYCLACNAIGIDVGDEGYVVLGCNRLGSCFYIITKAHPAY